MREQPRKRRVDVKDYGQVKLSKDCADDLLQPLVDVWDASDAKRLFVMAVLKASYGDIRDRDLALQYDTSFLSEMTSGVALSANTVSNFFERIGRWLSSITEFMNNRLASHKAEAVIIDGMLKDYNSPRSTMSEFSRKDPTKGSRDVSLIYAYSPELGAPLAVRPYPGDMLDATAIEDFLADTRIDQGMMILDKGFHNDRVFEGIEKRVGYHILYRSSATRP